MTDTHMTSTSAEYIEIAESVIALCDSVKKLINDMDRLIKINELLIEDLISITHDADDLK